jgi:septal ring factor EnvC (AmiA/AmiB activator)
VRLFQYTFLLFLLYNILPAQGPVQLNEKQKDLSDLRSEITDLEEKLKDINTQELNTLDYLEDVSKQELLLNKMINKLEKEGKNKAIQIRKTENDIKGSEKNIADLREKYADYVVWLYKQGDNKLINL